MACGQFVSPEAGSGGGGGGNVTIVSPIPLPIDIQGQTLSPLEIDIIAQTVAALTTQQQLLGGAVQPLVRSGGGTVVAPNAGNVVVAAANAARRLLFITNIDAAINAYLGFDLAADPATGLYLPAGGSFVLEVSNFSENFIGEVTAGGDGGDPTLSFQEFAV